MRSANSPGRQSNARIDEANCCKGIGGCFGIMMVVQGKGGEYILNELKDEDAR